MDITKYIKKTNKRNLKSDFSSQSEEECASNKGPSKRTKITKQSWPRFLVNASSNEGALAKLSPFEVLKGLVGLAGEPKSVKKLRSGCLLVEVLAESHSKQYTNNHDCPLHPKLLQGSNPVARLGGSEWWWDLWKFITTGCFVRLVFDGIMIWFKPILSSSLSVAPPLHNRLRPDTFI